jgi:hypothetical protein
VARNGSEIALIDMNNSILKPVYIKEKRGIAGIFSRPVYEYEIKSVMDSASSASNAPVVSSVDSSVNTAKVKLKLRHELTQEDFDKLAYIKQTLLSRLSPLLEEHCSFVETFFVFGRL